VWGGETFNLSFVHLSELNGVMGSRFLQKERKRKRKKGEKENENNKGTDEEPTRLRGRGKKDKGKWKGKERVDIYLPFWLFDDLGHKCLCPWSPGAAPNRVRTYLLSLPEGKKRTSVRAGF
jgi:hypothetical protein